MGGGPEANGDPSGGDLESADIDSIVHTVTTKSVAIVSSRSQKILVSFREDRPGVRAAFPKSRRPSSCASSRAQVIRITVMEISATPHVNDVIAAAPAS